MLRFRLIHLYLCCIALGFSLKLASATQKVIEEIAWNGRFPEAAISAAQLGPDGRLWIGTEGEGLFYWDGQELQFVKGLEGSFISDLQFFEKQLYIATDKGLFSYSLIPSLLRPIDIETAFPLYLAAEREEGLFIADMENGLRHLDEFQELTFLDSLPMSDIQSMVLDSAGLLLVSNVEKDYQWRDSEWQEVILEHSTFGPSTWKGQALSENWNDWDFKKDIPLNHPFFVYRYESHSWLISKDYLLHIYSKGCSRWIDAEVQEGATILSEANEFWLFNERNWRNAEGESMEISDIGLILDQAYDSIRKTWFLGSETGLYLRKGSELSRVNLPIGDPFVFSLDIGKNGYWIGTGEALLFSKDLVNWEVWPASGVAHLHEYHDHGVWMVDFLGDVFHLLDSKLERVELTSPSDWLGFVDLGDELALLSGDGILISLINENSLVDLSKGASTKIKSFAQMGELLALEFSTGISVYSLTNDFESLGFLNKGIDYQSSNESVSFVFNNSSELAILEERGWSVWDVSSEFRRPPVPKMGTLELAISGLSSNLSDGFIINPEEIDIPYHSSFLRLKPILSVVEDQRRWRFGYQLVNGADIQTEMDVEEVLFPSLSPGTYEISLLAYEPYTGRSSEPKTLIVRVIPPLWQRPLFIVSLVLAILLVLYLIIQTRIKRLKEENRVQAELSRLEGMALRLQMNPHFIFNALDSISNFIFRNKKDEAIHYLSSFARLIRSTLESAHEHLIPLRNEIDILRSYLELERMRSSERLIFIIDCDQEMQETLMIPPLVIQPYVENAVKHGLKPRKGEGRVNVVFKREENALLVIIEDDGIGRAASAELRNKNQGLMKGKSMSMGITRQRLELLNRGLDQKVRVEVVDLKDDKGSAIGTRVSVFLPLLEDDWDME